MMTLKFQEISRLYSVITRKLSIPSSTFMYGLVYSQLLVFKQFCCIPRKTFLLLFFIPLLDSHMFLHSLFPPWGRQTKIF